MKVIVKPRIELSNDEAVILDTIAQQWEEVCAAYHECETCPFDDLCNICNPSDYFTQFLKICDADPVYGDVESCVEVQSGKNLIKKSAISKLVDKGYTLNPTPNTTTIAEITEEYISFSNGDRIAYDHEQDCCEHNYADFGALDDLAYTYRFITPLKFEKVAEGFRFGDDRRMFFIPCYSNQNGYYTNEVDIYYNGVKQLEIDAKMDDSY